MSDGGDEQEVETVVVRDHDGVRQLQEVDGWTSMTLLGALSADPRTFDELARAWLRYRPEEPLESLPWMDWPGGTPDKPWVLLDLACMRVVAGGGAELPEDGAAFQRDEGKRKADVPVVWINVPPDWQWVAGADWQGAMAPLPAPTEPLDVRGILFGRSLAEGIAQRTLEVAGRERLPAAGVDRSARGPDGLPSPGERETAARWHALTVRVHADWLMTPREDLGGQTPRDFLHCGRDWVDRELENRERQWSTEGRAPRPLDRDTLAYRFGPLGRHEVVMYFDLCRVVIEDAWRMIVESPQITREALTQALHERAQVWLAEGSIDDDSAPPAVVIEHERRRMPLVGDGSVLDCDCPLCRMGAEGGLGPMFFGYDGYHLELDDEFAFSLYATREEWKRERELLGFGDPAESAPSEAKVAEPDESRSSVWSRSWVNEALVGQEEPSSPLSMLALASRVGELVADLKEAQAGRHLLDALNNAFDGFRAAFDDFAMSKVAAAQFVEALEEIASAVPRLTAKVADLESQLDELRRRSIADDPR
jgi:hypothetical protein